MDKELEEELKKVDKTYFIHPMFSAMAHDVSEFLEGEGIQIDPFKLYRVIDIYTTIVSHYFEKENAKVGADQELIEVIIQREFKRYSYFTGNLFTKKHE